MTLAIEQLFFLLTIRRFRYVIKKKLYNFLLNVYRKLLTLFFNKRHYENNYQEIV
jgi:hypothetical protein